jgi:hypothetical protein
LVLAIFGYLQPGRQAQVTTHSYPSWNRDTNLTSRRAIDDFIQSKYRYSRGTDGRQYALLIVMEIVIGNPTP